MASVSANTELSTQSRIASIGKLNYLDFFGFSAPPFRNASDVQELFLSDTLGTTLSQLDAALGGPDSGVLVINGAPGSGKTTLVNHAVDRHLEQASIARINRTLLAEDDFLQLLLHSLGLQPPELDRRLLIDTLDGFLTQEAESGRRVILVIDEAQNLNPSILKLLPELIGPGANPETGVARRFFIVLIGQDGFEQTLAHAELKLLGSRIRFQTYISPLSANATCDYIQHQLRVVGESERNPFSERAMTRIHMLTGGSMRLINTLCDFVLFNACLGSIRRITPELVQTTFNALQWEPARSRAKDTNKAAEAEEQISRLILEYDRNLEFPLDKEVITIGRSAENDLCIRNLRVSRFHARITSSRQGLSIEDLGSTNGVYVNHERIRVRRLKDGDIIAIDNNQIRLVLFNGS